MDTKQLITGSPKEGFYPIVQDTVTVIELNEAVMNLTSESSSEDIAAAFDSAANFNTLIEQIRNAENIVNGILMNNEGSVGKIICTIAAYKNQYACDIEYFYDGKIIRLDITNTDGTMSCIRKETALGGDSQNNIKYISFNNISAGTGTVDENIITTLNTLQDRDILIGIINGLKTGFVIDYYIANNKFYGSYKSIDSTYPKNITIGTLIIDLTTKESSWNGVSIDTNGDGSKFLSDNGTYKTIEAGDKTNVLILSLENDLANGQKDSPVDAEVSTALKDAITNGKACVIKSVNSDILANLQQISDNVTIVMEQISRVGQTFVAVNTSITVNTATNIISDYQTGALVLETDGDGNSFLADDGTYKQVNVSDEVSISSTEPINNEKIWIDTSAEPETTQVVVKTSSNQVDFNDNVAVSMNYNNNNETKSVLGSDKVTFNVPSGTKYNILFSPAANYNTPSRIEGTADTSIKYYSANYNATNITINLVSDSGDIKDARAIINEIEYENGQTLRVASGTELVITFKEVEGFKTPAEQSITATGANMTVTGSYESESAAHENVKAKQAILFYSMMINTMSLTDKQSLEVKYLYPNWETLTDKEVDVDFKFLYGDTLYKVLQKHTISKAWIPGQGTESLYTEINETHAGTKEDPIPYNNNMELESGKYYTQDGLLYMCNRNTGIPVYNKLADLVGIYVILIKE